MRQIFSRNHRCVAVAEGLGAPKGNRNALTHGTFTKEALSERTELRQRIRESEDLLRTLKESDR